MARRGAFSAEEKRIMREQAWRGSEEVARLLDRTEAALAAWIERNVPPEQRIDRPAAPTSVAGQKATIRQELKASRAWRQLQEELNPEEIGYFEEQYVALCRQFKDDVWATENTQIMLAIKYEILMSRNLEAKQEAAADLRRLIEIRDGFIEGLGGNPAALSEKQQSFLLNLETQITGAKAQDQARSKEFNDLETRHQALLKDLKATRDQRFSKVEAAKDSFLNLLKRLELEEEREAEGRQMNLMRKATQREHERLGGVIKYDDGNEDQPVLSADTVEMLDGLAAAQGEGEGDGRED
jgi:hypothetical protein